jgi:hypothetical protein
MGDEQLRQHVAETLKMFASMKREIMQSASDGGEVLPSCLVARPETGPSAVLMLGHGHPLEHMARAWAQMLEEHTPTVVLLFAEGYMAGEETRDALGKLEDLYRDDPGTDVREVLAVDAVEIATGRQFSGVVPFKLAERGELVFDEAKVFEIDATKDNGNIPSVLSLLRDATAYRRTGRGEITMEAQTYNGYPNVETWRVQLHLSNDDGISRAVVGEARRWVEVEHVVPAPQTFGARIREVVEINTGCTVPGGNTFQMFARDTVQAALARVDWEYLARLWLDAAEHEMKREAAS